MNDLLIDHNLTVHKMIDATGEILESYNSIKKNIPLQIVQLRENKFRYNYFNYRSEFLKGGVLYKDFCKMLRGYIITNGLFLPDGNVKCNEYLRAYCASDIVSFFDLAKQFTLFLL